MFNGTRLSEDLDFTGGHNFTKETLSDMGEILIDMLQKKYDLSVQVSAPIKESHNVDTWKVKIETRPESKNLPSQRINIDICALPSYEIKPTMILNHYNVDMGTTGLIVQAQSREEIFVDKLIALALRPNRIKYRDLWDIMWLHSKNITPRYELIRKKLNDRQVEFDEFISLFETRKNLLLSDLTLEKEFRNEMARFLPIDQVNQVLNQENFWNFIVYLIKDLFEEIMKVYQG